MSFTQRKNGKHGTNNNNNNNNDDDDRMFIQDNLSVIRP